VLPTRRRSAFSPAPSSVCLLLLAQPRCPSRRGTRRSLVGSTPPRACRVRPSRPSARRAAPLERRSRLGAYCHQCMPTATSRQENKERSHNKRTTAAPGGFPARSAVWYRPTCSGSWLCRPTAEDVSSPGQSRWALSARVPRGRSPTHAPEPSSNFLNSGVSPLVRAVVAHRRRREQERLLAGMLVRSLETMGYESGVAYAQPGRYTQATRKGVILGSSVISSTLGSSSAAA
jgi:hypothetical protein